MTQDRHIDSQKDTDHESHAAKLTAHALGQLDAQEVQELENALADGENEAETAELKPLGDLLREALQHEPKPAPSPTLRAALERRAAEAAHAVRPADGKRDERRGRFARWKFIAAVAAGVLLVAGGLEVARNYRNFSQPFQVAIVTTSRDVAAPIDSSKSVSRESASRESKEEELASNEHVAAKTLDSQFVLATESSIPRLSFDGRPSITSDDVVEAERRL